jgi:hypothetical protein
MILFSYLQETYNSLLKKRYKNDPSTHPDFDPDLWLETWSSSGSNRNRLYELSNTTAENLQRARSVSTIGYSQLVLSTQFPKFTALLDQRVQECIAHLDEKYEQLFTDYE